VGTVGGRRRVAIATALMAVVLVALLGAWFATGWHDVRARQAAIEDAPVVAAAARAGQLARELRGELDQLVEREAGRPYFHYQNLFHDPRAPGESVTPSPLASGPQDPLILGYFQIDANARVTSPSINDQFPQLSETTHLVEHRAFRDAFALQLAPQLAPPRGELIAQVESKPQPRPTHRVPRSGTPPPSGGSGSAEVATQAIESPNTTQTYQLDPNAYTQNSNANAVYSHQTNLPGGDNIGNQPSGGVQNGATNHRGNQSGASNSGRNQPGATTSGANQTGANQTGANQTGATQTGATQTGANQTGSHQTGAADIGGTNHQIRASNHTSSTAAAVRPVTITVSSLEWHTRPFSGGASLVAVREVETPDGNLAQGFVVDRAAMTSWLADHAGDLVAELHPRADAASQSVELIPGWELTVAPNPSELATSVGEAARVATTFLVRFLIVGAIALLAATLVVWLVARAERYARERSQFAAAAAHELRTPLAGLQLYGDMLSDGLGDPAKLRDYARRMSEEAARLGRVVSNVLGFSQLERGNLSIDPKLGDVAAALRDLVEHVQPTFDRAGAAIDLDVPESLDARFDRDALARIVGNLLDNAEKYTREAEDRTIHLTARRAGESIEIAVRDHGAGVAAPTKLFQAFARGVSADGPAGLGLGLALSRSLAAAMGGELTYREGEGATFVVRIPIA
jgi:signal transduction histidine kinase